MWADPAALAFEAGHPTAALEALLDAWKSHRFVELADLIERLDAKLTAALPPLSGRTRADFQVRWLELDSEGALHDVGRLCAALPTPPWTQVGERIARLARHDDPRVARAFARFFAELPTLGGIGPSRWTQLFDTIERSRDAGCRPFLERRLAHGDERVQWSLQIAPRAQQTLTALESPPLTSEDHAALRGLSARIDALVLPPVATWQAPRRTGPSNEAELLALVWERPTDDAPRLVYADWLQERGDPRAEFLGLQLKRLDSAPQRARQKALLKAHGRQWLTPIEPVITPRSERFERGFVATGQPRFASLALAERFAAHPAWNTFTALEDPDERLLRAAPLRGLRSLRLGEPQVSALEARTAPLPALEHLHFFSSAAQWRRLLPLPLPSLRSLWLTLHPPERATLPQRLADLSPLLERLDTLSLAGTLDPAILTWLMQRPKLRRLDVGMTLPLSFLRQGATWALDVPPTPWMKDHLGAARFAFALVQAVVEPDAGWGDARPLVRDTLAGFAKAHDIPLVPRP